MKGCPEIPKTTVKILKEIFFTPKISILMKFLVLAVTKRCYPEQTLSPNGKGWSGQVRTGQGRPGQVGQVMTGHEGQERSGEVRTGWDRSRKVRTGQDRSGEVGRGQDRYELVRTGKEQTWSPNGVT